jgi:Ca-activated chloride channel homolog
MAATLSGKSRLDEAKARVRERIDGLLSGQEIALVAFGRTARKVSGFSNNKGELRALLDALEVEDVAGDVDEALRVAQALARSTPFESVVILTDGNLPGQSSFELPFQIELQKLPRGGPNAGIVALSARRGTSTDWDVFVRWRTRAGEGFRGSGRRVFRATTGISCGWNKCDFFEDCAHVGSG